MEAWFNSFGYGYRTPVADSKYAWEYTSKENNEYDMSWYILTRLLDDIIKNCPLSKPITIFNDTRIIEELTSNIEPLTPYGKNVREWIIKNQLPQLICRFKKCSSEEIKSRC